jgi:hypothetical protein
MTPPPIRMDEGLHPTTGSTIAVPVRQLSNGAAGLLTYNLYSDPGTTVPWEGTTGVTSLVPTGSAINMNVYGKIDAGQSLHPLPLLIRFVSLLVSALGGVGAAHLFSLWISGLATIRLDVDTPTALCHGGRTFLQIS